MQRNYGFQIHVRLHVAGGGGGWAAWLSDPEEVLVSDVTPPFMQRPSPQSQSSFGANTWEFWGELGASGGCPGSWRTFAPITAEEPIS